VQKIRYVIYPNIDSTNNIELLAAEIDRTI